MILFDTATNTPRIPEIVAEISANHNGSLRRALDIVSALADTGVTSVKLQTYRPDTITLDSEKPAFTVPQGHGLWGGRRLYDLYEEAHTPWEWHAPIFEHARNLGLDIFSTPFDESAVDFLEQLGVNRYKVASIEIVDTPLIEKIAATGKPIVLSTGASTYEDVSNALNAIRRIGENQTTLLVCSSSYPSDPADSNLLSMATLREKFNTAVGFSDHTVGIGAAITAALLGATIIEKHVTLNPTDGGPDVSFSASPDELMRMISSIRDALSSLGSADLFFADSEVTSRNLRPSIWITRDVIEGELVSEANVATLRPSGGLPPSRMADVIGKRFTENVPKGSPLSWRLIEE